MNKLPLIVVVSLIAPFAFGCGSDNGGSGGGSASQSTGTTPRKPAGDPRPRVEGRWRLVYTIVEGRGDEERSNWTITPECPMGPCGARVVARTDDAKKSARQKLRFDPAIGDYQVKGEYRVDCTQEGTGRVTFKNAYSGTFKTTLSVVSAVKTSDGSVYATELFGERSDRFSLKPEAAEICAEPENEKSTIRAVRVDKPVGEEVGPDGKPLPEGPAEGEEPGTDPMGE